MKVRCKPITWNDTSLGPTFVTSQRNHNAFASSWDATHICICEVKIREFLRPVVNVAFHFALTFFPIKNDYERKHVAHVIIRFVEEYSKFALFCTTRICWWTTFTVFSSVIYWSPASGSGGFRRTKVSRIDFLSRKFDHIRIRGTPHKSSIVVLKYVTVSLTKVLTIFSTNFWQQMIFRPQSQKKV